MKKILITGTGGFVGARAMQQLSDRFEVTAFQKGLMAGADDENILACIYECEPEVIIHCAAISDVGYSEEHPDESYRANVQIPMLMAKGAKEVGAKLLAFSSDQVYTGMKSDAPFEESAELSPANVYGRHKLEAEKRVLDILPDAVMLRATWMYDLNGYKLPIRGNFISGLLSAALHNKSLSFSVSDYRGITYVRHVVEMLVPAMEIEGGVYNFGSENALNMYETACDFSDVLGLGLSVQKIEGQPIRSLSMSCEKLRKQGIFFDDTRTGIRRFVKDYNFDITGI